MASSFAARRTHEARQARVSHGAPRFVFRRTLLRHGRRVLLTTILLIEVPERQHHQADDQRDLEDKENEGQQKGAGKFPKKDAHEANGRELKDRLYHDWTRFKRVDALRSAYPKA